MNRAFALLALVSCIPPEEASAPAPLVVAPVAAAVVSAPPSRANLFRATTTCEPGAICPVFPSFPIVGELYFDQGRPCISGDRHGCLEVDGWHFTMGQAAAVPSTQRGRFDYAPEACRLAEIGWIVPLQNTGLQLFWQPNGARTLITPTGCRPLPPIPLEPIRANAHDDGIIATDPTDVWTWSSRFISHFDGTRWERTELPAPCTRDRRDAISAAVTGADSSIWFARCEEQTRTLVRFDPRTNQATATPVSPVLGLALIGGKVTATDFGDSHKTFRRHVYEADGRDVAVEDNDRVFLRAGFPDGTAFTASFGLFSEIQRFGGDKLGQTIALPTPAEGFYAPTPREVWAGGDILHRWRDGMMGKITYRPDAAKEAVTAIGGSGSNDVWVASRPANGGERGERAVHLSHWDGATWRQSDLPSDERGMRAFAVAGPSDAWLTTERRLWHWNGVSWSRAGEFPAGQGIAVVLTADAVFVLGNSTIYRRSR